MISMLSDHIFSVVLSFLTVDDALALGLTSRVTSRVTDRLCGFIPIHIVVTNKLVSTRYRATTITVTCDTLERIIIRRSPRTLHVRFKRACGINIETISHISNTVESLKINDESLSCFASSSILMGSCARLHRLDLGLQRLTPKVTMCLLRIPLRVLRLSVSNVLCQSQASLGSWPVTSKKCEKARLHQTLEALDLPSQEKNSRYMHVFTECGFLQTLCVVCPLSKDLDRNTLLWDSFVKNATCLKHITIRILHRTAAPNCKFRSIDSLRLEIHDDKFSVLNLVGFLAIGPHVRYVECDFRATCSIDIVSIMQIMRCERFVLSAKTCLIGGSLIRDVCKTWIYDSELCHYVSTSNN